MTTALAARYHHAIARLEQTAVDMKLPRSRRQSRYAASFWIFSLMYFNSNSIGLT